MRLLAAKLCKLSSLLGCVLFPSLVPPSRMDLQSSNLLLAAILSLMRAFIRILSSKAAPKRLPRAKPDHQEGKKKPHSITISSLESPLESPDLIQSTAPLPSQSTSSTLSPSTSAEPSLGRRLSVSSTCSSTSSLSECDTCSTFASTPPSSPGFDLFPTINYDQFDPDKEGFISIRPTEPAESTEVAAGHRRRQRRTKS